MRPLPAIGELCYLFRSATLCSGNVLTASRHSTTSRSVSCWQTPRGKLDIPRQDTSIELTLSRCDNCCLIGTASVVTYPSVSGTIRFDSGHVIGLPVLRVCILTFASVVSRNKFPFSLDSAATTPALPVLDGG